MFKKPIKLSTKTLVMIAVCALLVVVFALYMIISASLSDAQRLSYELKADGTYEIVDVKNSYRGGWFAKDTIVIPAKHKGVAVTSIKTLNLQKTKNVEISEGIKSIGVSAFYGGSVETVKLPSTLTSIGNNAFNGCHNLKEINLPEGIKSLANGTFKDCRSLASLTIPSTVTSIGNEVFNGCVSLTSLIIPDSVTSIGNNTFLNCTELKTVTLSASLEKIGTSAFSGCTALTSITIPENVTNIGANAFVNCTNLTSVTFAATSDWSVTATTTNATAEEVSSSDLANATTAASLLTTEHVAKVWTRGTVEE